jgi:hypothetical protein
MEQLYDLAHRCRDRRTHNSVLIFVALSYTRQDKILKFCYLVDQKLLVI